LWNNFLIKNLNVQQQVIIKLLTELHMGHKYQINLISDSTGETLDRIFLALKSQFSNFNYEKKEYVFIRTEQQINKIIKENEKKKNVIILYTIVEIKLAKYISQICEHKKIPCFGILGNLILNFSRLLNQKAIHVPSAQHVLDSDYYKRIEAIQFSMSHDDGMRLEDIKNADIILLGVSRSSKTPTSIYLANKGYKTLNIPLVTTQEIPNVLKEESNKFCVIGLTVETDRLSNIRSNRLEIMKETNIPNYSNFDFIQKEIENSKKLFEKYNWPIIDVTRKSVEETAASIIRIFDIKKRQKK
jgi:regulator of PEP synthase PpsR (kinase-PPPase family)